MATSPTKLSAHAAVEQELFNIFTFYTLHGSAKDPERMTATQFKNFAKDVQLPSTVLRADLDVLFRRVLSEKHAVHTTMSANHLSALWRAHSALTHTNAAAAPPARAAAHTSQRKFDFADFINALMHLAVRAFPSVTQVGAAFQQLLMQHVLPLASRRRPIDISMQLADPALHDVRRTYDESMREIFEFYLQKGALRRLDSTARHTAALSVGITTNIANARGRGRGTGDGRTMSHEYEKYRHGMLPDPALEGDGTEVEEADHLLCYPELLKLAADFKFDAFVSSLDLGDAFLSAVSLQQQREQKKEEWERWRRQSERLSSPGSPASPKSAAASPVTPGGSVLAVGTGPGGVPLPAALGLHFDAFWEFMLRVALMAFGSATFQAAAAAVEQQARPGSGNHLAEHRQPPSPADSVLGLFLHMWRAVHDAPPTRDARQLSGYLNTVITGTRLFKQTFFEQWKRDQFRDYVGGYRSDQASILRYGTRGRRRSRTRAAQASPSTPSSSRPGVHDPCVMSSAPITAAQTSTNSDADARAARALAASLFGLTPSTGGASGDSVQKLSISPALQDLLRQQPEVRRLLLDGLNTVAQGDDASASDRKR